MELSERFAAKLKELREEHKVSQRELGRRTGIHFMTISRYERGLLSPSIHHISLLSEELGVNPWNLFMLTPEGEEVFSWSI